MRKAFKAGGERANKITLSPPRPAIRTDVQAKWLCFSGYLPEKAMPG